MRKHVDLLRDMDNIPFASSVWTTHSFSMYGLAPRSEVVGNDLSCPTGRQAYFSARKPCHITKERMNGSYFSWRLDGLRHERVHALRDHHCQYCYYVWANFSRAFLPWQSVWSLGCRTPVCRISASTSSTRAHMVILGVTTRGVSLPYPVTSRKKIGIEVVW
jgi:hypothetical protein